MDKFKQLKSILGEEVQEHIVLRDYTTMKVGGVADYFYIAKTIEELVQAVLAAKKLDIPFQVLGGGSNILVSDFGFGGLIILNRTSNLVVLSDKAQIIVDSGVSLVRLITEAANRGLSGLEGLYGIPGTIGGAVYGNVGANGTEIIEFLKSVTVLSTNGKILKYPAKWLEANYRLTRIKKMKKEGKEPAIILSLKFQLAHNKKEDILRRISYYKKLKEERQPYNLPSAGSIFKNPGDGKEKSAGFLLEKIGAKKIKIGDAEVSKKHANFIINRDQAKAQEIRALIDELREKVREHENINLEEEIEYVGQW